MAGFLVARSPCSVSLPIPPERLVSYGLPSSSHGFPHLRTGFFSCYPSPSVSQHPNSLSFLGSPCPRVPSARVLVDPQCAASSNERAKLRPSPAEAARTLMDVCTEGTLCTLSEETWPLGTAVRFTVDSEGNPIFCFHSWTIHKQHLEADNRCSLHVQMEQPLYGKPQCTLKGRLLKAKSEQKLQPAWESRFSESSMEEQCYYVMSVEGVLHASDLGEEGVWVSGSEYSLASPDPPRECAAMIVEDMNRKHWEDIRRFCNVYCDLDLLVEEAHMTWVDCFGFDMRILTPSQEIREIRIPFSREVTDERDARSSLTMMAQIAWEFERNYSPPEIQMVSN